MPVYTSAVKKAVQKISAQKDSTFAQSLDRNALLKSGQRVLAALDHDVAIIQRDEVALFNKRPSGYTLARLFTKWRESRAIRLATRELLRHYPGLPAQQR